MCWSAEVSLNTFLFSLFGASFAYFNDIISGSFFLFFFSIFSMQLVEYFTWKNLNNKKINRLLSQIGLFLVIIQIPLFVYSRDPFPYRLLLLGLFFLLASIMLFGFNIDFSMNKAANGHLAWNWLNLPSWMLFMYIIIFVGLTFFQKKYMESLFFFIVIGGIYYTYRTSNTWGSLWCWLCNFFALKLIGEVFLKELCF